MAAPAPWGMEWVQPACCHSRQSRGRGEEASCPPLNPRNPPFPSGQLGSELPGPGCTPSSEARGDDGITTLPQAPLISFALSIPFSLSCLPPNLFPFLLSHTSPLSFTNGKEKLLNIAPESLSKTEARMSEDRRRLRRVSFAIFGATVSFKMPNAKSLFRWRKRREIEPEW